MNRTTRATLDAIDAVLAGDDQEAAMQLWDVLTALRGPDNGGNIKTTTTCPVRAAAFPQASAKSQHYDFGDGTPYEGLRMLGHSGAFTGGTYASPFDVFDQMRPGVSSWHFANHVRKAAKALGLE